MLGDRSNIGCVLQGHYTLIAVWVFIINVLSIHTVGHIWQTIEGTAIT